MQITYSKKKEAFITTVALTGGGTAGHVLPALSLLSELKKRNIDAIFIGGDGMEKELVPVECIPFFAVTTVKFDRKNVFNNIKIPKLLSQGTAEAERILRLTKADAVFCKGGYASLPASLAAKRLKIPVIVHESDCSFGLANKIVKKFAAKTLTSFPETDGVYVGNPIRGDIFSGNPNRAKALYPTIPGKKTLLVFGGSSGAAKLNEAVYFGLERLTARYNVIHISGKSGDLTKTRPGYFQLRYTSAINDLYALSDVVVARGGANTLAELAALNKPAVIVPLPKGISRGDQIDNALSYRKRGYFRLLPQEELTTESLLVEIDKAVPNPSPEKWVDSRILIADEIEKICRKRL